MARAAANALRYGLRPDLAEDIERAGAAALSARSAAALLSALEQALAALVADAPAGDPGAGVRLQGLPGRRSRSAPRAVPCAWMR